jgi:transcriptional regulator with XRE-family HTH domain
MARVELGERIASLREEQALTQAELAERARISPSTLSQIESGRVPRPHVGTVRKIARALSVEPQELRRAEELAVAGKAEAPSVGSQPEYEVVYPARSYTPENREKVVAEAGEVAGEAKQDYDPNAMRIVLVDDGETIEVRAEPVSSPSLRAQRNRRATRSS